MSLPLTIENCIALLWTILLLLWSSTNTGLEEIPRYVALPSEGCILKKKFNDKLFSIWKKWWKNNYQCYDIIAYQSIEVNRSDRQTERQTDSADVHVCRNTETYNFSLKNPGYCLLSGLKYQQSIYVYVLMIILCNN